MSPEHDLLGSVGKIYESSCLTSQWSGFLSLLARGNRRNGNQAGNTGPVS